MENKNTKIIACIPARYLSTRLPAKPLADICGKTMLQRVWEGTASSKLIDDIFILTDDQRIFDHCLSFDATPVMTPTDLKSGTDRILFALNNSNIDFDIVVNVQGDEPMISGDLLDSAISGFVNSGCDVGTIIKKIDNYDEIFDTSVVKVVLNKNNNALYFSRNPIPYLRDIQSEKWAEQSKHFKHIGIYIYLGNSLLDFGNLEQSQLEQAEKLEQLRFLANGYSIFCYETEKDLISVDTEQDLEKVRKLFSLK